MTKARITGRARVNVYEVLARAVEEGVRGGYRRAHKHVSSPDEDQVCGNIEQYVMNAICEYLIFDDPWTKEDVEPESDPYAD